MSRSFCTLVGLNSGERRFGTQPLLTGPPASKQEVFQSLLTPYSVGNLDVLRFIRFKKIDNRRYGHHQVIAVADESQSDDRLLYL